MRNPNRDSQDRHVRRTVMKLGKAVATGIAEEQQIVIADEQESAAPVAEERTETAAEAPVEAPAAAR
ncbi:hypothetical protein [Streptomyces boninensis]|uniref:hypothetical protein n=1 Tax=Streptomyces boninensis TaxID=2039455 RepID=UPI003B222C47